MSNELPNDLDRGFKGVWIPKEIWLNEELSWLEKCLAAEINSLDNEDRGGCTASNGWFAKHFGLSERQISRSINRLKKLGLVKLIKTDGRNRWLGGFSRITHDAYKLRLDMHVYPDSPSDVATRQECLGTVDKFVQAPIYTKEQKKTQNIHIEKNDSSTPKNKLLEHPAKGAPKPTKKRLTEQKIPYGEDEHVWLTEDEHSKLVKQYGEKPLADMIQDLDDYIGSKGAKYKSHYKTIKIWFRKREEDAKKGTPQQYPSKRHPAATVDPTRTTERQSDFVETGEHKPLSPEEARRIERQILYGED